MKTFNVTELRAFKPCYDPARHLPEDFNGTILDILDNKNIPFEDRLWVILRTDFVSEKLMRLFAVWCARQVQHLMKDERSLKALDVAEAFANGTASKEELAAAWYSAWYSAKYAADAAAYASDAAWYSAKYAADAAADAAMTWTAARVAQENKLREMIIAGMETGDTK